MKYKEDHMAQPDGYTDNRREHVKKVDSNGNAKAHPLASKAKPKLTPMQKLMRYNLEAGQRQKKATAKQAKEGTLKVPTSATPTHTKTEKAVDKSVGFWDYDPEDRTKRRKR